MFIDLKGKELLKKNLYKNFVMHMCNLSDFGLVSPEVQYKTIQKLQRLLSSYEEGRQVMAAARESQLEYWRNVGINKQKQLEKQKKSTQNFDLSILPKQTEHYKMPSFVKEEKVLKKEASKVTKGKDEKIPTTSNLTKKAVSKTVSEEPSYGRKKAFNQSGKERISIGNNNQHLGENGINKRKYSHLRGILIGGFFHS